MTEAETNTPGEDNNPARGFRVSAQPVVQSIRPVQEQTQVSSTGADDLPASSGSDFVYLIARDPKTLFVYWDLDWPTLFSRAALSLRPLHLRVCREDGTEELTTAIDPSAAYSYLPANAPDTQYYVELGCFDGVQWRCLAHSALAATPAAEMSDDLTADFATLPLHLSFQRLLDIFQATNADRDTLARSVARLQDRARVLRESISPSAWRELLETAAASGNNEAAFGLTGARPGELSALLQRSDNSPAPTAEMFAQWRRLGERFSGSSWGGESSRNFGQSSRV